MWAGKAFKAVRSDRSPLGFHTRVSGMREHRVLNLPKIEVVPHRRAHPAEHICTNCGNESRTKVLDGQCINKCQSWT
jgi:hypothetical protein